MLVSLNDVLRKAQRLNYAVGAFNFNNMEFAQAIVSTASKFKSPVILQTSEGALRYAGFSFLKGIANACVDDFKIPIVLHLDHGRDFVTIKRCISSGWSSVMFDGSHLPFDENVKLTRRVVSLASRKGVSVEGELGTIGGVEESVSSRKILLTDPAAAKDFVDSTGVDALAVAIGTSHGAYKFSGRSKLDVSRLSEIKKSVGVPLVLHGASGVPRSVVDIAAKFGAKLGRVVGVSDSQVRACIRRGVCKVNTDTDLRLAFMAGVRKVLKEHSDVSDPRSILGSARDFVGRVVEHRLRVFGSVGRAR